MSVHLQRWKRRCRSWADLLAERQFSTERRSEANVLPQTPGLHFAVNGASEFAKPGRFQLALVISADQMPWPTQVLTENHKVSFIRPVDESCSVQLPWSIEGIGDLFLQTTRLIESEQPYPLLAELARGEVSKLREQLAEWEAQGLHLPENLQVGFRDACRKLYKALGPKELRESELNAYATLRSVLAIGEEIVKVYSRRAIGFRNKKTPERMTKVGGTVDSRMVRTLPAKQIAEYYDHLTVPVNWHTLEPRQGEISWKRLDQQIDWCLQSELPFSVGPLLDFRKLALPDWLWLWENDPETLVMLMIDLVETCVHRYEGKVQSWEVTARTNSAELFGLNEEQLLWLSARLLEVARDACPDCKYTVTVDQPWGNYMAGEDRTYTPFSFLETLIRMNMPIAAINLEVAMGYQPGGSYCRHLLDFSRLLDSYHQLNKPLRVRLFYPSQALDEGSRLGTLQYEPAGNWHGPVTPEQQAEWLEQFVSVALAKPFVEVVTWGHHFDPIDGDWPLSGLFTAAGQAKPALNRLRKVRRWLTTQQRSTGTPVTDGTS